MISMAENHQGNFHETLGTIETRGIRAKKMIRGMKVLQSAAMIKGAVIKNPVFFG